MSQTNKPVFIVDSHQYVLEFWESFSPKYVITFDHHTDTKRSFSRHTVKKIGINTAFTDFNKYLDKIQYSEFKDYYTQKNIKDKIEKLQNDEHIDFALHTGIVKAKVFVCYSGVGEVNYTDNPKIYKIGQDESRRLSNPLYEGIYDSELPPNYTSQSIITHNITNTKENVLSNACLELVIEKFKTYSPDLLSDYILDIDLDYFTTLNALKSKNLISFYNLIRNARAITIAREVECVKNLSNKGVTANKLEELLLKHIKNATT